MLVMYGLISKFTTRFRHNTPEGHGLWTILM